MKVKLTLEDVLHRYREELLPEFLGIEILNVNQKGGFGNTPLNVAATRGNIEEVSALLDAGADPDIQGEQGCTPLHDAVGQGHREVVVLLLQRGASINIRNDSGVTPRERAIQKKNLEMASLFDRT